MTSWEHRRVVQVGQTQKCDKHMKLSNYSNYLKGVAREIGTAMHQQHELHPPGQRKRTLEAIFSIRGQWRLRVSTRQARRALVANTA